ncbi:MAG: D-alanyl-D-alanine carboxypeptidase family protein [Betaproteobacteria bacterium]|nr:D-alanyl-D-alanine carboxypeptidase family protein [Betaproteobacteria bacterium]
METDAHYLARIAAAAAALGLPMEQIRARGLPVCGEAVDLVVVETDLYGRAQSLAPEAAAAWWRMKAAAEAAGLGLHVVSGFRSFDRQTSIIRRKIEAGQALSEILKVSAPPGYSEHHTGLAVDIATPGCPPFEEPFAGTQAFAWLGTHAGTYGFHLSFPRDNAYGYAYEPWHWCYRGEGGRSRG